ncbi:response regulator transcription factor [Mechercharimyces sp. CAU 1602]|uniref:response regulator transcription factor n=1 Tax=Mechercharimyces sp. CAU 1602 TaxID=2973933 RepID=UPI0021622B4D|nr:response regulator transcription factor [Mechercharimyces sp. CAU 1602]MCS1352165.1 response regulator transcription factor [Mechercharimyces sp. CAU 1602]
MNQRTVLVVDDDKDIVRLITETLQYEQFTVIAAYSGQETLEKLRQHPEISFLILDIMMPGIDGLEVCRRVRAEKSIPILLLSARDREMDKVIGLEIGADDYMTKPFSVQELAARVKAHFRKSDRMRHHIYQHQGQVGGNLLRVSRLVISEHTYEAFLDGEKLDLSTKEFQILHYLVRHANQVLTREQVYANVWGDELGDVHTVTVHIKNLRKKLGNKQNYIKTVWGVGYKFIDDGGHL